MLADVFYRFVKLGGVIDHGRSADFVAKPVQEIIVVSARPVVDDEERIPAEDQRWIRLLLDVGLHIFSVGIFAVGDVHRVLCKAILPFLQAPCRAAR